MGEPVEPARRNRAERDGLAALAIVLLAFGLIAMVINHFI